MSWNFKSLVGSPDEVLAQVDGATPVVGSERAQGVVDIVASFIHDLVDAHSDSSADIHVAVSSSGHTGDTAGNLGESVTVSMTVLPAPNSPTVDPPSTDPAAADPTPPQPTSSTPFTVPEPVVPGIAPPAPGSAAAQTSLAPVVDTPVVPPPSVLAQDHAAAMAPPEILAADPTVESDSPAPPVTGMSPSDDPNVAVPIAGAASDTPSQDQGNTPVSTPADSTQVDVPTPQPVEMGSPTDPTPASVPAPDDAAPGTPAAAASASVTPAPAGALVDPAPMDPAPSDPAPLSPEPVVVDEFPFTNNKTESPRFGMHFRPETIDGKEFHVYQDGQKIELAEAPLGHEPVVPPAA